MYSLLFFFLRLRRTPRSTRTDTLCPDTTLVGSEPGASDEDRLVQAARGGEQDSINETGRQVVERQLRVPPTITIRPGFKLRVIVTRDLILEPLGGGDR